MQNKDLMRKYQALLFLLNSAGAPVDAVALNLFLNKSYARAASFDLSTKMSSLSVETSSNTLIFSHANSLSTRS